MTLGEIILELRNERQLSQKQVADAVDISQSTIAKIEINRNEATASTLRKLANFFGVSADYLLGLEDELGASSRPSEAAGISSEELKFIEDMRKLTPGMRDILRTTLNAMIKDKIEA